MACARQRSVGTNLHLTNVDVVEDTNPFSWTYWMKTKLPVLVWRSTVVDDSDSYVTRRPSSNHTSDVKIAFNITKTPLIVNSLHLKIDCKH